MRTEYRRVTLSIPADLHMSLKDQHFHGGYIGSTFPRWLVWALADWLRREKKRMRAWEKRHGRKLGDPE